MTYEISGYFILSVLLQAFVIAFSYGAIKRWAYWDRVDKFGSLVVIVGSQIGLILWGLQDVGVILII